MSRIDEALRLAAVAALAGDPDDRFAAVTMDPRAPAVIDPSSLERFGPEKPLKRQENRPARPSEVIRLAEASRPVRFEAFPAWLEAKLVVSEGIAPATVEQYRRLAASLHHLQLQQGIKTILVSSALPREGKTLTITNLALTLSESYHKRVLLVDADLRRPSLHEVFDLPNKAGLADLLRGEDRVSPIVEVSPYLSVLPTGPLSTDPMAQLCSERIGIVVREAGARFDWVLLDTPPVGLLPDAQFIAQASDGVLFVIAAGVTPYEMVQRGIAALGADRVVGTVLNRVEERSLQASDYYGHYQAMT